MSQRLQKTLSVAYPDATVARGADPKIMVVRWPDGRTAAVAIDKVERDCAATPSECDAVMRRYARTAGLPPAKSDASDR